MTIKQLKRLLLLTISILLLAACQPDSNDVPSLQSIEESQPADEAETVDLLQENEAAMMAFTQCLRDQGIEVNDPMVDADGNIGKPEIVDAGIEGKEGKDDFAAAFDACAEHIEGFTFAEKGAEDMSQLVDEGVALATCMREKGYDMDDPTAESFNQWRGEFKEAIDWEDPAAIADYEECSGITIGEGGGK